MALKTPLIDWNTGPKNAVQFPKQQFLFRPSGFLGRTLWRQPRWVQSRRANDRFCAWYNLTPALGYGSSFYIDVSLASFENIRAIRIELLLYWYLIRYDTIPSKICGDASGNGVSQPSTCFQAGSHSAAPVARSLVLVQGASAKRPVAMVTPAFRPLVLPLHIAKSRTRSSLYWLISILHKFVLRTSSMCCIGVSGIGYRVPHSSGT